VVESKIKAAAGFRLELAMPGVFMRQRGFCRGEKRRIGAISTANAAAHAKGIDFRAVGRITADEAERARSFNCRRT